MCDFLFDSPSFAGGINGNLYKFFYICYNEIYLYGKTIFSACPFGAEVG